MLSMAEFLPCAATTLRVTRPRVLAAGGNRQARTAI
jgi:hypothetical protein